ncbi:MAG: glycosyltransferase [Rhodobacterales bacterium]|nr:glycosyltransferase [Rhodobacterales bacterium]MDX5414222.1 glycosyltransferase [Rhodobacterales bacterium]
MTRPQVSVVIVSRHRADALKLCLTAVSRLSYPEYEVIVVADPDGLRTVEELPFSTLIKTVPFDEANISAARNRGIAQAAGEIVAFLDDDSVPETRWLDHLAAAFDDPAVAAAGGYVLGRNGITPQWQSRVVDQSGEARNLSLHPRNVTILTPPEGQAVKTEGTNMALRRDVLSRIGGFDPAFRFYLDETDVNMRLAQAGHATALVPLALVHHGYAASATRRADRAVRDLRQIAASTVVFLRKHCPASRHAQILTRSFEQQRKRILTQMVSGLLEPRDIRRLLRSWNEGEEDGRARLLTEPVALPPAQGEFMPFRSLHWGDTRVIAGHRAQAARLRAQAAQAAQEGRNVSLFLFSYTTLYHRVRFHPDGYWEQTGGVWGRSDRSDPMFRGWSISKRVEHELARIGASRF